LAHKGNDAKSLKNFAPHRVYSVRHAASERCVELFAIFIV